MQRKPPITRTLSLASATLSVLVLLMLIGPGCLAPGPDDPDGDSSVQEMAPEMTMMTQQALVSTGPVNLAQFKATTQSSTYGNNNASYGPWIANEGYTATGYFNHTADGDANPWWQVDLGQDQLVGSILIYNRDDNATVLERLNGAKAELINNAGQTVQSWALTGAAQQTLYAMDGKVGRRLKISRSGGWIHLREVQVFSPVTTNVAEGKAASQSSNYLGGFPASSAVDGDTDSGFTHTNAGDISHTPWWEVDLGGDYPVSSVEVYNRVDCCSERLNGATVRLQNAAHQDVKTWALNSSAVQTFWAAGSAARYVRITQPAGSWWAGLPGGPDADGDGVPDAVFVAAPPLSLTEVAVKVPFTRNIAPGKSASQSPTYANNAYPASNAIDGNVENFTHTDNYGPPMWTLDLGATSFVTSVDVYNRRSSCCLERLNGAEIVLLSSVTPYREVKNTKRTLTGDPMQRVDFITARRARYVRITRPGDYLSLAEVAVNSPIIAPAVAPPSTEFCWLDSYGRNVGQVPTSCPNGATQAGLCYEGCTQTSPHGTSYSGVGPVCWENCPSGYDDTGAFCYRPGDIYGNGCNGQCNAGYTNDGCTCRRDPITFAKHTYTINIGQVPTCAAGLQYDAGLCYTPCAANYDGVGPVCWQKQCPAGMVACGAGCAKDQATCNATLAEMITAPFQAIANIAAMVVSFGGSSALTVAGKVVAEGVKGGIKEGLKQGLKAGVNTRIAGDTADKIHVKLDPMESTNGEAIIDVPAIAAACDPTGLASLGLAFVKPICGE